MEADAEETSRLRRARGAASQVEAKNELAHDEENRGQALRQPIRRAMRSSRLARSENIIAKSSRAG